MSGLVAGLIGLAAWFADRAVRSSSRSRALDRAAITPRPSQPRNRDSRALTWLVPIAGAAVGAIVGGEIGAIAGAGGIVLVLGLRRRRRARREVTLRDEQLADAVRAVAAGLRAGLSVPQSLAYAAGEGEPPLADALRSLVGELELGVPLDEALVSWGGEVGSTDARLLVGVLGLHRRSGGDLPAVLDQVAGTLRERRAVDREIRALTAQARMSGSILGLLPIGFFGFLWLTSRSEIEGALRSSAGIASVIAGLGLEAVAFLWIRRLLEVR